MVGSITDFCPCVAIDHPGPDPDFHHGCQPVEHGEGSAQPDWGCVKPGGVEQFGCRHGRPPPVYTVRLRTSGPHGLLELADPPPRDCHGWGPAKSTFECLSALWLVHWQPHELAPLGWQ